MKMTSSGRPKRSTRKQVNYTDEYGDTAEELEKYLEKVQKDLDQRYQLFVAVRRDDENNNLYVIL